VIFSLPVSHFTLKKKKKGNRWKFVDTYKLKVPHPFTVTELMSLHLSKDLFKVFKGTVFFESLESMFEKVLATLPPESVAYLERIQSTFHMGIRPYKDYERFRKIIEHVNQAATERLSVEVIYKALANVDPTLSR